MSNSFLDLNGLAHYKEKSDTALNTALAEYTPSANLAAVATSGDYDDLLNKPTIPDVSGKEDKANKVTSLSDQSTDTQYPSAKATYDAIEDGSVKEAVKLTSEKKANQEFVYRAAQNTIGADALTLNSIKGNTVAWNQLSRLYDTATTGNGIDIIPNSDGSVTLDGTTNDSGAIMSHQSVSTISGHKYLIKGTGSVIDNGVSVYTEIGGPTALSNGIRTEDETAGAKSVTLHTDSGVTLDNARVFVICIDLTLMFGAGNEPSTVAEFDALFPNYDPSYNAGELLNNTAKALETVGFNQWDEEWEVGAIVADGSVNSASFPQRRTTSFFRVIPGATYYISSGAHLGRFALYDADKNLILYDETGFFTETFTIPANAYYLRITVPAAYGTTYNHDICINLSDPAKNGTYEPYWKRELPLNLASIRVKSPNIWDEEWELGTFDTTTGENIAEQNQIRTKNRIPILPNTQYYISFPNNAVWAIFNDANGNVITSDLPGVITSGNSVLLGTSVFKTPQNSAYMRFYCLVDYGTTYNHDICINESNQAFNGKYFPHGILTIQQPMKSAGDVYNEKDWKFYERVGGVDLGELNWSKENVGGHYQFYSTQLAGVFGGTRTSYTWICSKLEVCDSQDIESSIGKYGIGFDSSRNIIVAIKETDNENSTESDFKTAMSGVMLYYELADERVYELAEPLMLSMPAGTTERIIADGMTAPMVCDMTYGVNPAQLLDDMNALSKGAVPSVYDSIPSGGFLPNVAYDLGTLTGTVTFTLATGIAGKVNHYVWSFDTGSTAPTITWPTGISWVGSSPNVIANKHYEVSVYNGVGVWIEV